jgi:lysophospholipase L1-like esterase
MISTLFAGVVKRFRGLSREPRVLSPRLEVLEDRCLPSATTSVPALADLPPIIALSDLATVAQPKGNPAVAFVGDSISWEYAYGTGAPIWSALMAPLGMSDYGVYGQTTQSLLFQLSLGQLAGIQPAVVVLDIGGDNLLQGDSPQATAAGVLADVAAIHSYLPQSQVLVLGILPGEQSPSDPYRLAVKQTNQLVSQTLAGDPHAAFVDLGSLFLQPDGSIATSMMFDYLHPTEQGYLKLTAALLPALEQTFVTDTPAVPMPSVSSLFSAVPSVTSLISAAPSDIAPTPPPPSSISLLSS